MSNGVQVLSKMQDFRRNHVGAVRCMQHRRMKDRSENFQNEMRGSGCDQKLETRPFSDEIRDKGHLSWRNENTRVTILTNFDVEDFGTTELL